MTETIMSSKTTAIRWADVIEYPQTGVKSKTLLEDASCRYTLMLLGAGIPIAEHTNPRNATVSVIEGQGVLTLEGKALTLEAGVFIFVPANAHHAIKATTNLAFLLILSERAIEITDRPRHQDPKL
jgi:quercetin dioxygenase-like cupin family protein